MSPLDLTIQEQHGLGYMPLRDDFERVGSVMVLNDQLNMYVQSKFDNSKRKGPQEIFRMIESSNFRESSKDRKCSVIFIQTMV